MVNVNITVTGIDALQSGLADAQKQMLDFSFAMGEIGRDILKRNKESFMLRGTGQYAPLSKKYAEQKTRRAGRPLPILVGAGRTGGESGRLRDSATRAGAQGNIFDVQKLSLRVGSDLPYSRYVQEGTRRMPGRPYMFIKDKAPEVYANIVAAEVDRKLKQAGIA